MVQNRITGIDEAGRGCIIGPMVMCGVSYNRNIEKKLAELGVKDSKKLTAKKREYLYKKIKNEKVKIKIYKISPAEIDRNNLNSIELKYHGKFIRSLNSRKFFIDAPVNPAGIKRYKNRLMELVKNGKNKTIHLKNKAEDLFVSVATASIVAKFVRDSIIEKYKRNHSNIGSGYPADKRTIQFLSEFPDIKSLPKFVRKSWKTLNRIKFIGK